MTPRAGVRRAKRSNRATPDGIREYVLGIVRERYADVGPTLAGEKLMEVHGVAPGLETLREWMTEAGLWQTRMARRKRAQSPRSRARLVACVLHMHAGPLQPGVVE